MVVFAGTFDPITKGHEQVIKKCVQKYGGCLVVVGENAEKKPLFTQDERVSFIIKTFYGDDKIKVVKYSDYKDSYAEFLQREDVKIYVRGIRNRIDLKYEKAYEKENKKLYPEIKTKYIKVKKYNNISSTLIKELLKDGKDLQEYLPEQSLELIKNTYRKKLEK